MPPKVSTNGVKMMAILIDVEVEDDANGDVMCSDCSAVFNLQWKRSPGVELSYCPFCGVELEDELDAEV
jgi:rRNA maturation endonuclease Nob1